MLNAGVYVVFPVSGFFTSLLSKVTQLGFFGAIGIVHSEVPDTLAMTFLLVDIDAEIEPVGRRKPVIVPAGNIVHH